MALRRFPWHFNGNDGKAGARDLPNWARRDPRGEALTTFARLARTGGNDFLSAKIFQATGKISEPVMQRLEPSSRACERERESTTRELFVPAPEDALMRDEIARFTPVPHADAHPSCIAF